MAHSKILKIATKFRIKLAQISQKKTAVIITGNPKYITDNNKADAFYKQIQDILEDHEFTVTLDPGEPYTEPPPADLWVGHSRGVDRLEYAPKGTKTIGFGAPSDAINHPDDSPEVGKAPSDAHYMLNDEMNEALLEIIEKIIDT